MNNGWISTAVYWLVDVHVMATVVLVAALIALGRIRQPARRLAVMRWTLAVLLCVPPLAVLTLPRPRAKVEARVTPGLKLAGSAEWCDCKVSGAAAGDHDRLMVILATSYATCNGLVVAWLVVGAVATARLRRRAAEAPGSLRLLLRRVVADRATTPPRLCVGDVTQPVALGLLRPTIVLPAWFVETEPESSVAAALAHEWAHLHRGDLWTLAASRVLFVVFFSNPLFHVLRGRLRAAQEVVADAEAAGPGGALAYAEALVGWARRGSSSRSVASSLGLLGRSTLLRERIALLLDPGFRVEPTCPRGWKLAVRGSAAALLIGLGVLASTGVVRAALAPVVPVVPRAVPHTHTQPLAVGVLGCPSDPVRPGRLEVRESRDLKCAVESK